MMKLATSVGIALLISGSSWAQSGFSGTVTNSNWGVTLWFESKLEPPTPEIIFTGKSVLTHLEKGRPGMRRYTADERTHEYFGYDVNIEPLDPMAGTFRVSFAALPSDAKALELQNPGNWHRAPSPGFPRPETLKISEMIAVDLFEDPGTGQKVVDYIHFTRDNCDSDTIGPRQLGCLHGKLNDIRQSLKDQLGRADPAQSPIAASRVRDSQRAWESYLQATCAQITSETDRLQCELRLTRSRVKDLSSIASGQP